MWLAYIAALCALDGASRERFKERIFHAATELYTAEWLVWPPAQVIMSIYVSFPQFFLQAINFYLLPTRFRLLYDNVISLGFDCYCSHVLNDECTKA